MPASLDVTGRKLRTLDSTYSYPAYSILKLHCFHLDDKTNFFEGKNVIY